MTSPSRKSRSLLPCPFCGAAWNSGLGIGYKGQPATSWHVCCMKCKVVGPDARGADSETANDAVDLWNRRAPRSESAPSRDAVLEDVYQRVKLMEWNGTSYKHQVLAMLEKLKSAPQQQRDKDVDAAGSVGAMAVPSHERPTKPSQENGTLEAGKSVPAASAPLTREEIDYIRGGWRHHSLDGGLIDRLCDMALRLLGAEQQPVALGAWDDEAIGEMAGAALQAVPKLGYMDTARRAVNAVIRVQNERLAAPQSAATPNRDEQWKRWAEWANNEYRKATGRDLPMQESAR